MRFGLLSTYPPTQCGPATFTKALGEALSALAGCSVFVVRALDGPAQSDSFPGGVTHNLVAGDWLSVRRAAEALNGADVVVVQHEYGIYGGPDGVDVVSVLRQLSVPVVVVLHTVLASPSRGQRSVLELVCGLSDAVVVMSEAARGRLLSTYRVAPARVHVIPHGVTPEVTQSRTGPVPGRILTWGLIGPGKGIEWGIRALAGLRDLEPTPEYLVAGQTHPKVLQQSGEEYRDGLRALAASLEVDHLLRFDATYRPTSELPELIAGASVVLLPYDSAEQVTSGVLIEAVAAGRPVVATRFPHAEEVLRRGAGVTVAHRDHEAMARAMRRILIEPALADSMSAVARREAATFMWPAVAKGYLDLGGRLSTADSLKRTASRSADFVTDGSARSRTLSGS